MKILSRLTVVIAAKFGWPIFIAYNMHSEWMNGWYIYFQHPLQYIHSIIIIFLIKMNLEHDK